MPVTQVCDARRSPALGLFDADRAFLARFIFLLDSLDRQFGQMLQLTRSLEFKRVFKVEKLINGECDEAQKDEANNPI